MVHTWLGMVWGRDSPLCCIGGPIAVCPLFSQPPLPHNLLRKPYPRTSFMRPVFLSVSKWWSWYFFLGQLVQIYCHACIQCVFRRCYHTPFIENHNILYVYSSLSQYQTKYFVISFFFCLLFYHPRASIVLPPAITTQVPENTTLCFSVISLLFLFLLVSSGVSFLVFILFLPFFVLDCSPPFPGMWGMLSFCYITSFTSVLFCHRIITTLGFSSVLESKFIIIYMSDTFVAAITTHPFLLRT